MAFDAGKHNSDVPADDFIAVTPHASTDIAVLTRALYIGTGGDVVAVKANGDTVTFSNVQAGTIIPIRVRRVNASGTTATNIVALI